MLSSPLLAQRVAQGVDWRNVLALAIWQVRMFAAPFLTRKGQSVNQNSPSCIAQAAL